MALNSRTQQIHTVAQILAGSAEATLLSNDLSSLRRLITETSQKYELQSCTVALSNGQIMADSIPVRITQNKLPQQWPKNTSTSTTESIDNGLLKLTIPISIPGRGDATINLVAPINRDLTDAWKIQMKLGIIAGCTLAALLAINYFVRPRLRAMSAIRQALLNYQGEQTLPETLLVSPLFGHEAIKWNTLLEQTDQLRRQKIASEIQQDQGKDNQRTKDLDHACNTMSQGLILVDSQMCIRYLNGAAAVFASARREDLVDATFDKFTNDQKVIDAIKIAVSNDSRQRSVLEIEKNTEHGPAVLRYSIRPVRHNDPGEVIVIVEDITQQRVAERARNEFVTQVAHEFRTPLSNMRLYVESLLEDNIDHAMQSKAVNVINFETKRLTRLVSDMLSVAEIEAGSMKIRTDDVNLKEIFKELKTDYDPQAVDKQIDLSVNLPPKLPIIQADRDKLLMALHNLVSNAVKYTPTGGNVQINVDINSTQLVTEISDSGIGINEQDQKKIFEKFYRASDKLINGIPGTGLGLSLAREIIRLHGGDITVDSQHGQGSTFTLAMPITADAA